MNSRLLTRLLLVAGAAGTFGCTVNRDGLTGFFGDARSDSANETNDAARDGGAVDRGPDVTGLDAIADTGSEVRDALVDIDMAVDADDGARRPDAMPDVPRDAVEAPMDAPVDQPPDMAPDAPADDGNGDGKGDGKGDGMISGEDAPVDAPADGTDDGIVIECLGATHLCGVTCVRNADVASCGTSCSPCPAPAHSAPTCDGTTCDFVCGTGYHRCGNGCASDTDPATCGTSCGTPCPAPANAVATCDGTTCDFACDAAQGFHRCGDLCVDSHDPQTCGQSCTPCVPPANATSTCDGTSCGSVCNSGLHRCNGTCVSNNLITSCGPTSCMPCTAPPGSTPTCDGTACSFTCPVNMAPQNGMCVNACNVCDTGAIPVTAPGGRFTGTTSPSVLSSNTGSCGGGAAQDVVYKLTLTTTSDVFVTSHGSNFDTVVYMRRSCCSNEIACNNDADGRTTSVISARALTPGTYYIFLDGLQGAAGDYTLDIFATPAANSAGDACGSPLRIANNAVMGNSCMFQQDYDPPNGCSSAGASGADAVYYFVLDTTSTVSFNTCSNTCIDSVLYVRDICTNAQIASSVTTCNDNSCNASGSCYTGMGVRVQSQINSLTLGPGVHYLMVDTHAATAGDPTPRCGMFTVTPNGIPN